MDHKCLNCNENISRNYCDNCGQKASTHRFSLEHFFLHDFVHGIFHLDKGFLFTIKELFTRPGHSIREYIQGKRASHFNYFTTLILLLTIGYFLSKVAKVELIELYEGSMDGLMKVLKDYSKITIFLGLPVYALSSYVLFKKSKQNYTENLVINLFMLCGSLVISFVLKIFMIFSDDIPFLQTVNLIVSAMALLYVFIFFYQYFSVFGYNKISLFFRSLMVVILFFLVKQGTNNLLNEIGLRYLH